MGQRLFSTLLLWAIVGTTVGYFRTEGALVLITLLSVLTLREFYQLMHASGYDPFDKFGIALGGFITLGPWLQIQFGWSSALLLPLGVIVFAIRLLGERTPENRVESLSSTLLGLAYVPVMLAYLVAIVTPVPGDTISSSGRLLLCLWLIIVTKFCDMGALISGLAFGRTKMSPQISPKKTWEGAAGGVVLAMGAGAFVAWLARDYFPLHMTPVTAAFMAVPIALIGIVADLVESVLKRRAQMKDSGSTIPGIGGMFDLSDSVILAAPIGYFLFRLP